MTYAPPRHRVAEPPCCPRHPDSKVTAAGTAKRATGRVQRWRCDPTAGQTSHLFLVSATVRPATPLGLVVACPDHAEAKVHQHGTVVVAGLERRRFRCLAGHTFSVPIDSLPGVAARFPREHAGAELSISRRSSFTPADVASALVRLGRGETYREVSSTTAASGEQQRSWRLAADWVDAFSPTITSGLLPAAWPDTLMVGFVPVGTADLPWGLLVAAQRVGDQSGELVAVRASQDDSEDAWLGLFASLSGAPRAVTGESGSPARAATRLAWPARPPAWVSSQWHLRRSMRAAARDSRIPASEVRDLIDGALDSPRAWADAVQHAQDAYPQTPLAGMLAQAHGDVTTQLRMLDAGLGAPRTSAPVLTLTAPIVAALSARRGRIANLERTQRLIDLMVVAQRGDDDAAEYARVLDAVARTGASVRHMRLQSARHAS